ncbi:MAG: biotin--[acetyl-CoA-carboxylase] ligase [Trebonia sp.]
MGAASKPGALLDADAVRAALAGPDARDSKLGAGGLWTSLEVVAVTGSTNADLLRRGGAEGQVLVAESQVAGRGRMGRSWVSAAGASLTFSVLLRPVSVPAARRGWLPLLTGVSVACAVRDVSGVAAALKWPNDVLAGSRKLAGILAEQSCDTVVIGIGLNVATPADALPVSPSGLPATSLLVEGASVSREALLAGMLRELGRRYTVFRDDPDPARAGLLSDYRALCATLGRSVRVELPGGRVLSGVAEDIDADGRLLVAPPGGASPTPVSAGDVIHVRLLRHLHRDFVVRDALVPAAERRLGRVLDQRLLVVVPREPANRVQVGEPGYGGEGDLPAFVPAQQLGAAEPVHRRQVLANLCLVVTLIIVSPVPVAPTRAKSARSCTPPLSVVLRFVPVFCRPDDRKQEQSTA